MAARPVRLRMTDWMPVVGAGVAGVLATLGLILNGLRNGSDLVAARRMSWITVAATSAVYSLYLVLREAWLWYE